MGITYWDCDEYSSSLLHDDIDEAIKYGLEDRYGDLPETIRVWGFDDIIPKLDPEILLNEVLERMDQDYLPDDYWDGTEPTPKMIRAAEEFCRIMLAEYGIKSCGPVTHKDINVKKWLVEQEG